MGILKALREANNAVRKGNEYRLEKYGPADTFAESFEKAQQQRLWYKKTLVPKSLSMFASNKELQEQESFKMKFQYWDEWTGGRFARRENPYLSMTVDELRKRGIKQLPEVQRGKICRSNPVTGYWEELDDRFDED